MYHRSPCRLCRVTPSMSQQCATHAHRFLRPPADFRLAAPPPAPAPPMPRPVLGLQSEQYHLPDGGASNPTHARWNHSRGQSSFCRQRLLFPWCHVAHIAPNHLSSAMLVSSPCILLTSPYETSLQKQYLGSVLRVSAYLVSVSSTHGSASIPTGTAIVASGATATTSSSTFFFDFFPRFRPPPPPSPSVVSPSAFWVIAAWSPAKFNDVSTAAEGAVSGRSPSRMEASWLDKAESSARICLSICNISNSPHRLLNRSILYCTRPLLLLAFLPRCARFP